MISRYPGLKGIVFFLGLTLFPATLLSQSAPDITRANLLYNQNKFKEAAEIYEEEIKKGRVNGHLHYNLGNAYFRNENLAGAVLNYAKAQSLLPRNEDIETNLQYAIRQTEDQLDGRTPHALESILFWTADLNLKEHGVALLWINLAFWISMAVRLHSKTSATRSARNTLLAFLVLASLSTGFKWQQVSHPSTGVILPAQINVHSGWNATTTSLFQLHQGTLVTLSQDKDRWYEIVLPDGKKGWVSKSDIAR